MVFLSSYLEKTVMSLLKSDIFSGVSQRKKALVVEQAKVKPEDIPPAQEDSRVEESDNKDGPKPQSKQLRLKGHFAEDLD